jgi:hypothetical protein
MNAILAIIANGGRAIIVIDREGLEINYFLLEYIDSTKNPLTTASSNPFRIGSRGVMYARPSKPCRWRGNGSIMVGMFVSLCLASQKLSKREFFVPAGTDLGVKLLRVIINELF